MLFYRYDALYIAQALEKEGIFPTKIQNGSSIIMMTIKGIGVRFIDSFSFLPRPLRYLALDFKLPEDERKGHFPYLFNTRDNQDYVGGVPGKDSFGFAEMNEKDKCEFAKWHDEQVRTAVEWRLKTEIVQYCRQDTRVLAKCLISMRANFWEKSGGLDCFDFPTMASASITALQFKFLPADTIGIVPLHGYGGRGLQSKVALEYLAWYGATFDVEVQVL